MEAGTFFAKDTSELLGGQAPDSLKKQFARTGLERSYASAEQYLAAKLYPGRGAGLFGPTFAPNIAPLGAQVATVVAVPAEVAQLAKRARHRVTWTAR